MISLPIQEHFRIFIRPHLAKLFAQLNYPLELDINRVTLWADSDKFNFKEDPFVWAQVKDKIAAQYGVYFDGIHVCLIEEGTSKDKTLELFWKGFLKAYNLPDDDPGKIWLDQQIYEDKRKEADEKKKKQHEQVIKAIESKQVKSETDKIAKEIALDAAKESPNAAK